MSWANYVQAAQALGFTKVTIMNRTNYQVLAHTSAQDVATAWQDGDKQVNENQELLDDWNPQKSTFCFYGKKFNILVRDEEDGNYIVGMKGKEVVCVRQFKSIWFVAYGVSKKKGAKDNESG
eukprot:98982_1